MARKITPTTKAGIKPVATRSASVSPVAKTPPVSTPVRNSAIPKAGPVAKKPAVITHEAILRRAYEIFLSGTGGNETDNWLLADASSARPVRKKLKPY